MVTLIDKRSIANRESAVPPDPTALPHQARGRGSRINMTGRYEPHTRALFDDGSDSLDDLPPRKTQVFTETPKQIITTNDAPDNSLHRAIHPYQMSADGSSKRSA